MANKIGIAREQQIFAVLETTKGTLAFPAATDLIVAAGFAKVGQQPSFSDSPEIVNSRDILDQFQDKTPPGEWSFPIIARPSGTAGTEPNGDVLYESLMGKKTVNAGVSVVYSPALTKPSFSLWVKKSHTVLFCSGCTVGQAKVKTSTKGAFTFELSGKFMRLGWAGTDELSGASLLGGTAVTVLDASKYTVGARIKIGTNDNGGAGYEVTAVNTSTNVLTLGSGLTADVAAGDEVTGFLPTGTQTSVPLENRKSTAKVAGLSRPMKSMDISITDDPDYLDDEITTDGYPADYAEAKRNVSGALDIYFRQDDLAFFHDGRESNELALELDCGDTAGAQLAVVMPKARLSVPDIQEADPTIALNIPFKALGTDGEDSISITFK